MQRWDGRRWRPVPLQSATDADLVEVSVAGPMAIFSGSDSWLLTEYAVPNEGSYILHWDGHQWSSVLPADSLPPTDHGRLLAPGCDGAFLNLTTILAFSPHDIWMDGQISGDVDYPGQCPVFYHWDGVSVQDVWPIVPPADFPLFELGGNGSGAFAMAGSGPTDVWAIAGTLLLHWDGHALRLVTGPPLRWANLAALSSTDAWALGPLVGSAAYAAYHWDGAAWRRVSTEPAG